jgi:hypothetical protein
MSKIKNKALNMGDEVIEKEYFFSDIKGQQITVKAVNKEEAEKKAKQLIK